MGSVTIIVCGVFLSSLPLLQLPKSQNDPKMWQMDSSTSYTFSPSSLLGLKILPKLSKKYSTPYNSMAMPQMFTSWTMNARLT